MAIKLILRSKFKKNFLEAISFYNQIDTEIGKSFKEQVGKCILYIEQNPYMFQKKYGEIRAVFTKIFPYAIYYVIKETQKSEIENVYIINILHTSRKVNYKTEA